MRVHIYVEGPSDKLALGALLSPLLAKKLEQGVLINFFEAPSGNRKSVLLNKVPKKAASIVINDPHSVVVVLPDLYPRNVGFPHETAEELYRGIRERFVASLMAKGKHDDPRYRSRFEVFCLKYDLEALILASERSLARRLNSKTLKRTWTVPVEDQDQDNPPRRIVEALFTENRMVYQPVVDAPVIVAGADYVSIAKSCNQCFGQFVDFINRIS